MQYTLPPIRLAPGPYPERDQREEGPVESALQSAFGWLSHPLRWWQLNPEKIVAPANAHEARFRSHDDAALKRTAVHVRARLREQGFTLEAASEAFALVREVARRTVALRPFDVQLMGGWAMVQGALAEMHTGEGKTLTATMPACVAALAGRQVHIVTVNDYLAKRDAQWMSPIYEFLGLTVGVIVSDQSPDERRTAYGRDITYCTNKDLVFDYLRDRILVGGRRSKLQLRLERIHGGASKEDRLLLRGLQFAIVDEADSVLIDEARTPLVISDKKKDVTDQDTAAQALAISAQLVRGRDFVIDEQAHAVRLTDQGKSQIRQWCENKPGFWAIAMARENIVSQAISATHVFKRDHQYLVQDGKVVIVDEFTGRVMPDRSWEKGLHQLIEAKEGVEITGRSESVARITYQRFFTRYLHLCGMTGTAKEVAPELWSVYRLPVVSIPTHITCIREYQHGRLFATAAERWEAVAVNAEDKHAKGQPVLIGTRSVEASEIVSSALSAMAVPHQVLNARQDGEEAEMVARAGELRTVTVATNMAGRGTDIRLSEAARKHGGLHVVLTEYHESARIDRQLFGRCARQGDPGSAQGFASLDDELFRRFTPWIAGLLRARPSVLERMPPWVSLALIKLAQWKAEGLNAQVRKQCVKHDRRMEKLTALAGRGE